MRARWRIGLGALLVAALAVAGVVGWRLLDERAQERARARATETAQAFATAWESGDYARLGELTVGEPDASEVHRSTMERLGVEQADVQVAPAQLRDPDDIEAGATATFRASLDLGSVGTWSYRGRLPLRRAGQAGEGEAAWRVAWTPEVLHPSLSRGDELQLAPTWPERAPILDRRDEPLEDTGTTLGQIVGHTDEVTEEQLQDLEGPYRAGDVVGQRGLQLAFEDQLAGTPTVEIQVVDGDGEVREVLETFEGRSPRPLRTTLDVGIQRAAEAALGEQMPPSALVVVDAATSEIRAVVNRPSGGFNRAMAGQYAPGSTFKVVSAAAFLRGGLELDTTVECPATVTVGGRRFQNYQDMALGEIPFRTAIFRSCNTAFVQLAADAEAGAIDTTAEDFGFDVDHSLPIGATVASFPAPGDVAERAAAAIGQGRVLATPTHMASVAAGIASGEWRAPTLIRDRDPVPSAALDDVAPALREAMQEVPRRGTAEGAGLPDGVGGKTGTAEVGTAEEGEELPTNAWFIGFTPTTEGEEQLAFAVIVEGGESGGSVAAPVATRFLRALDRN